MALVKWESSKEQDLFDYLRLPAGGRQKTDNVVSNKHANSNSYPRFYCKRVITEKPEGKDATITRIEEMSFGYNPGKFKRKSLHSSKSPSGKKSIKKRSKTESKYEYFKQQNIFKVGALTVILGCNAFLWWFLTMSNCQLGPLKLNDLEASLRTEVFGQEEAINSLILNFYRTSNMKTQPPVMLLCGSTGVGKSLISDVITNNFGSVGHTELLTHPVPFPKTIIENLNTCRHNLIVIDGLHISDAPEMANWTSQVQQAAIVEGKQVWMILAFTTWSWSPDDIVTSDSEFERILSRISENIGELFRRNSVSTQLVALKPLEVRHIKTCVLRAVSRMNLVASEEEIATIVGDLTDNPDQRRKGCKHVPRYLLQSALEVASTEEDRAALPDDEF